MKYEFRECCILRREKQIEKKRNCDLLVLENIVGISLQV
jgi:hypothetical protein